MLDVVFEAAEPRVDSRASTVGNVHAVRESPDDSILVVLLRLESAISELTKEAHLAARNLTQTLRLLLIKASSRANRTKTMDYPRPRRSPERPFP